MEKRFCVIERGFEDWPEWVEMTEDKLNDYLLNNYGLFPLAEICGVSIYGYEHSETARAIINRKNTTIEIVLICE